MTTTRPPTILGSICFLMCACVFGILIIKIVDIYLKHFPPTQSAECWVQGQHIGPSEEAFTLCWREAGRKYRKLQRFLDEP